MARTPLYETRAANLSASQMRAAIPKLERRIADLEGFEVGSIQKRFDPITDALAKKVSGTLQEILGHDTVEYKQYAVSTFDTLPLRIGGGEDPIAKVRDGYREGIHRCLLKLQTLKELFQERIADAEALPPEDTAVAMRVAPSGRRVFVVHGRDDGAKETVARYLSNLDLEPIILHEQPNQGRTVIEKFEDHSDVAFAVVLFTPDDTGHPAGKPDEARSRARQNVVLELGFFMSALGRHRVCVLYRGDVEIPSDYSGVLYLPFDDAGAWRFLLARELKASGIDLDMNKVI